MSGTGELIVFTNGCFDLLHIGHIQSFKYIKEIYPESILHVGLNCDESVFALKGHGRPIFSINDRKEMLESIKYIDYVHIFNTPTPLDLIKQIKPDIIVKGMDYYKNEVVGYDIANVGITLINFKCYISTTEIIRKIREN